MTCSNSILFGMLFAFLSAGASKIFTKEINAWIVGLGFIVGITIGFVITLTTDDYVPTEIDLTSENIVEIDLAISHLGALLELVSNIIAFLFLG